MRRPTDALQLLVAQAQTHHMGDALYYLLSVAPLVLDGAAYIFTRESHAMGKSSPGRRLTLRI